MNPVGTMHSNNDNFTIKLAGADGGTSNIRYIQHAVDLATVLTVWKAQGSTFDRVILLLEGSTNSPGWDFEHLYVAASRVRNLDSLRCFALSPTFKRDRLLKLQPDIFTENWIMDLDADGQWRPRR